MPIATGEPSTRTERSRRRVADLAWPSLAAGAVVLSCLVWLAWQAGGYFAPDYLLVGAILLATAGAMLLVHVPTYRLSTPALVGLGALASYAAWSGLSRGWAPSPDAAIEAMHRNVVHVAIFGLALLAAGSGRYARHLVWGVLATICLVAGAGLISRLYPDVIRENLALAERTPYRLSYPWTYWNAAGAFAAMGCVLATGLAADPRTRVSLRALTAGAAVLLFLTMYLTFSRGAWLALIVGAVVLVALAAHRGSLLLTALVVGVAVTVALLRLRSYPALTIDPSLGSGQESSGSAYAPQMLVVTGAAVTVQAVIAAGRASEAVMAALRRVSRPARTVGLVAVALFGVISYGVRGDSIEGQVTTAANSTTDWISHQWNDFLRPTVPAARGPGAARLVTARGTRADLYRVAFDGFEARPLFGEGAGSFEPRFIQDRRINEFVRNAHSLELETLSELGLAGITMLLAFIGSLVAAVLRSRRKPGSLSRSHVAAVGATCAVWLAHSAVDWDWQMTALTGTFLVVASTLYPYGQRRARRRRLSAVYGPPATARHGRG